MGHSAREAEAPGQGCISPAPWGLVKNHTARGDWLDFSERGGKANVRFRPMATVSDPWQQYQLQTGDRSAFSPGLPYLYVSMQSPIAQRPGLKRDADSAL